MVFPVRPIYDRPVRADQTHTQNSLSDSPSECLVMIRYDPAYRDSGSSARAPDAEPASELAIELGGSIKISLNLVNGANIMFFPIDGKFCALLSIYHLKLLYLQRLKEDTR